MLVFGGRAGGIEVEMPLEVYDTETSEWYKFKSS